MKRLFIAAWLALSVPAFAAQPSITDNPLNYSADQSVKPVVKHLPLTKTHPQTKHHTAANDHEIGGEGQGYTNVDGRRVHSPKYSSSRPAEATAKCGDGTWSFSQHSRGTCSHHGGVASR